MGCRRCHGEIGGGWKGRCTTFQMWLGCRCLVVVQVVEVESRTDIKMGWVLIDVC